MRPAASSKARGLARLNTLGVRLFLLLWLALILAHYTGYALHGWREASVPRPPAPPSISASSMAQTPWHLHLPRMMNLSPADGLPPPGQAPNARPHAGPVDALAPPMAPGADDDDPEQFGPSAAIDYGVRLLVFGAAAWLGAWWVVRPLRRLNEAAERLDQAVGQGKPLQPIDDASGPQELRETARVFNDMARRLGTQFEERSMMMAAVSHDLRTPLTRLRLRLERMDDVALREAQGADVAQIDQMVSQVLEALRQERTHEPMVRLDLGALVQATVDDLQEAGGDIQLQPFAHAEVMAEPQALRRVLDNLMGNALRHGLRARVQLKLRGEQVLVIIDDQGPGIPQEHLDRVFKPFHRVDAARQQATGGVGLGLFIARQLAMRHGGQIELSNRSEGGLRAVLLLAVAAPVRPA
jgi:signal transduction histidine kinase